MKTILLSNRYDETPFQMIQSVVPEGFLLEMLDTVSQVDLMEKANCADYMLVSGRLKIDRKVLEKAVRLKMIQRTGVGIDSLDLNEIKKRKLPVYVNQGVNAQSVAEHSLLLILSALRRLPVICSNTKNGIWKKQAQGVTTKELATQTVGLIGMGNIGKNMAKLLRGFGCKVLYYDTYRQSEAAEAEYHILYRSLNVLLQEADVISLHCPLTEETKGFICSDNIEKMKDGVVIVNTARGQLIDERDLLSALDCGKVAWAGLDVFCEEPTKNTELLNHENVICTPHIAGVSYDSFYRMMKEAMRNIALYDRGNLEEIERYRLRY